MVENLLVDSIEVQKHIDLQKQVVEFENELESDPEDEVPDLGDVVEEITSKITHDSSISVFCNKKVDKTAHNSRKFAFTLSPTNYGYWKTMIEPFPITNNLTGYVDVSIPGPSKTLSVTEGVTVLKENTNYPIWVSNDAHVHVLIISAISEASFHHVQEMHDDEIPDAYLNHAQEYADALAASNHWSVVKRILRYLHGSVKHGMLIRRSGSTLQAFTDVLWKGNPDTSLEAFLDADRVGG
ncbi:hypothetical protein Tco_0397582 [Tanacetum coccineum]